MQKHEEPTINVLEAAELPERWTELLSQVEANRKRVLIERSGVPMAAIISARDLQRFQQMDAQREADFQSLWRTGEAFKGESPEAIEREVARAVKAVRRRAQEETERPAAKQ